MHALAFIDPAAQLKELAQILKTRPIERLQRESVGRAERLRAMRSGAMPHLIQFGSAVRQNELCEVVEVIELREPVFALGQANNPAEQIGLRVDGLNDAQNSCGILGQGIRTVLLELLDQILFEGIPARQGSAGQGA